MHVKVSHNYECVAAARRRQCVSLTEATRAAVFARWFWVLLRAVDVSGGFKGTVGAAALPLAHIFFKKSRFSV